VADYDTDRCERIEQELADILYPSDASLQRQQVPRVQVDDSIVDSEIFDESIADVAVAELSSGTFDVVDVQVPRYNIVVDVDNVEQEYDNDGYLMIKRPFQPNYLKRKRKHGFLKRMQTPAGRRIIRRRIKKGRWRVSI
jgi:large subunit ribosomal protein L34